MAWKGIWWRTLKNKCPRDTDGCQSGAYQGGASGSMALPNSAESVRNWLWWLNIEKEISWEKLGANLGVPGGTLWDIASGKPVPRKWRKQLGLTVFRDLYAMPISELRWAIRNRR